jgi:3-hydroxy-D-aspartate aldolase
MTTVNEAPTRHLVEVGARLPFVARPARLVTVFIGYCQRVVDPPASVGTPLEQIDTPALLIDLDALDENISRMAQVVSTSGVRLRPHAKTHKCPAIAHRQIARGAVGVCCQTVGEAEVMASGGVTDILITNEVWGASKLARLAALARRVKLAVCVDDHRNVAELSEAALSYGSSIEVLVEINVVGDIRCGVDPEGPALALARKAASSPGLRFAGIQAYAGKAQHVREHASRQAAIRRAVEAATATKRLLESNGLECSWVTGSGTGTYYLEAASGVYTELQAGSYVFMDADYGRNLKADGEPFRDFEQSLFVYSTIMSRPTEESAVLDAGIKSSSFDSGPPVLCGVDDTEWLGGGDEHFRVRTPGRTFPFAHGAKVRLIPGHCDPTVNMYDWYAGVREQRVESLLPVAARGCSR